VILTGDCLAGVWQGRPYAKGIVVRAAMLAYSDRTGGVRNAYFASGDLDRGGR
jgi:hypothetical protein